jgi:hypothetical protein
MKNLDLQEIERAKEAALEVLLHNAHGPFWVCLALQVGVTLNLIPAI